jgi:hypothetical protein
MVSSRDERERVVTIETAVEQNNRDPDARMMRPLCVPAGAYVEASMHLAYASTIVGLPRRQFH